MSKAQLFLDKCHEVATFCRMRGPKIFGDWPDTTLLLFVAHHALHGTLFVRREAGLVTGTAFAWPEDKAHLHECEEYIKHPFNWHKRKKPNCIFVAEVVANRCACRTFFKQARKQWPEFKRFYTFRRGKLRDISRTVERFA